MPAHPGEPLSVTVRSWGDDGAGASSGPLSCPNVVAPTQCFRNSMAAGESSGYGTRPKFSTWSSCPCTRRQARPRRCCSSLYHPTTERLPLLVSIQSWGDDGTGASSGPLSCPNVVAPTQCFRNSMAAGESSGCGIRPRFSTWSSCLCTCRQARPSRCCSPLYHPTVEWLPLSDCCSFTLT